MVFDNELWADLEQIGLERARPRAAAWLDRDALAETIYHLARG